MRALRIASCVVALACVVACGGGEEQAKRREVLVPRDVGKAQRDAYERTRLYDSHGNLVPSETKVAGVILPRGMTQQLATPHEWYFEAALPQDKLQRYFSARLSGFALQRPRPDTVELYKGTPNDTQGAPFVMVRISPSSARDDRTQVVLRQAEPPPSFYPTPEQARERLAQMQQTAQ